MAVLLLLLLLLVFGGLYAVQHFSSRRYIFAFRIKTAQVEI